MEVTAKVGKPKAQPYPRLVRGKVSNNIYLMLGPDTGVVLKVGDESISLNRIGGTLYSLDSRNLEPFNGEVNITAEGAITVTETPQTEGAYPRLVRGAISGTIYLQKSRCSGIVLKGAPDMPFELGLLVYDLNRETLEPFHGSVTITD